MTVIGTWGPGGQVIYPGDTGAGTITGGVQAAAPGQSLSQQQSAQQSTNVSRAQQTNDALSQNFSQSYIPEYSQTPILEEIAKYSRDMAPKVYQWGMDQFDRQQGNIDALMRNALSYASPQRIRSNMGMAEAGVQQGAEAGRQSAIRDLQSFGIDPSSGRYAALDTANRVMAGASAAGAGNQQRMADIAQGNAMQNQALAAGAQNIQTGYGAAGAANQLLGTAASLKYAPLGNVSAGTSASTGQSTSTGDAQSTGSSSGWSSGQAYDPAAASKTGGNYLQTVLQPGWGEARHDMQEGGAVADDATTGGFVSQELSPSNGNQVDDVQANLNAGEFVVPKDVTAWLGQGHFYKLMAQARKARVMAESNGAVGYGAN